MQRLPVGYAVRLASIKKVGKTFVKCEYIGHTGERAFDCPMPYPYAGHGGGIIVGPEIGTTVLVANGPNENKYIVGFVPARNYFFEQEGIDDIPYNTTEYPSVEEGEVQIKSSYNGAYIKLTADGDIALDAGLGNYHSDLELSQESKTMFLRTDNICQFTEAGRKIEGVIKRDKSVEENATDTVSYDFLTGTAYDSALTTIGRSPYIEVQNRTTTLVKPMVRNPALVEKREIVYEYANTFGVGNFDNEIKILKSADDNLGRLSPSPGIRSSRRTDVLNLSLRNFNHLIEKVEGTLVDIYGNVVDINRNKISIPNTDKIDTTNPAGGLKYISDYLRRSVKFHWEVNSRKDQRGAEPSNRDVDNRKKLSRWSVDIDAEGLTKLNIPASSEIGNIPVLSRYVTRRNSGNPDAVLFTDKQISDVKVAQFGAKSVNDSLNFAGQSITNTGYIPRSIDGKTVTVGTAFHDITNVASSIFTNGKWKKPDQDGSIADPISSSINNKMNNEDANAGGRSLHANLDGSIEMSIGADSVDRKSVVLDTAGGIVSSIGRDKNGRSIIQQIDGDVIIQVGGKGVDDNRFSEDGTHTDKPGRVEIHVNRPGVVDNHIIIIDENGLTIKVQGNATFSATGDMTLSAGGTLLLDGESICAFGSFDDTIDGDRSVGIPERKVARNGKELK